MTRISCLSIVALAVALFVPSQSRAAVTYDLALRAPGESASLNQTIFVTPGESIAGVELVLIETISDGTASILGDDSAFVGGFGFNERAGNLNAFRANLTATGSDGSFANLATTTVGNGGTAASDADTVAYLAIGGGFGQPGIQGSASGPNMFEVVLGTVDLTAPTSGETTFTLSDFSAASDFTTFDTGSLEIAATSSGGSFNNRSLTVSAVPEPSSVAVLFCAGGAVVARYRRRRKTEPAC